MSPRAARLTAWALAAFVAVLGALTVVAWGTGSSSFPWTIGVLLGVIPTPFSLIGALIVWKRPDNRLGWLFVIGGAATALSAIGQSYADSTLTSDPGSSAGRVAAWILDLSNPVTVAFIPLLFLLFPGGRLESRSARRAAVIAIVGLGLAMVGAIVEPTLQEYGDIQAPLAPATPGWIAGTLVGLGFVLVILALVASAVLLVRKLRRASGRERDQLRLLAWAAALATALLLPAMVIPSDVPRSLRDGAYLLGGLGLLLIPASVGVAILRHRLLDIDLVIRRTVVVALLGAFITAVYVGAVVGVGALVGERGTPVLSAAAAAFVALAFQPVRRRAQRVANRLVYGKRATPYEVLSVLANRMGGMFAADDLLPRIARVLAEGTGAEETHVWLRIGDELRVAAVWPSGSQTGRTLRMSGEALPDLPAHHAVPVRHHGELLGALSLDKPAGETISPTEEKLVHDVASQSGLALRNVRLTEELRSTIEELRASRQRLVRAQDDERRKLERNIHDGAQQQLVALAVKIRMVDAMVDRDAERAHTVLAELQADAQDALEELRDLARGLYPPLLADEGLQAALESQARKAPVPVAVHAVGIGRYPQDVETTAYFCCLEALQNVAKYAEASAVQVLVSETDGELTFEVTDDGRGFDPERTKRGAGLQNMIDRLEAIGGALTVTSAPGEGATVRGRVPVDAPAGS